MTRPARSHLPGGFWKGRRAKVRGDLGSPHCPFAGHVALLAGSQENEVECIPHFPGGLGVPAVFLVSLILIYWF